MTGEVEMGTLCQDVFSSPKSLALWLGVGGPVKTN